MPGTSFILHGRAEKDSTDFIKNSNKTRSVIRRAIMDVNSSILHHHLSSPSHLHHLYERKHVTPVSHELPSHDARARRLPARLRYSAQPIEMYSAHFASCCSTPAFTLVMQPALPCPARQACCCGRFLA